MHPEVRKMEGRSPSDEMSGSSPDVLENYFVGLSIGTRKKTAPDRLHTKTDEKSVGDDHGFQDTKVLEQWNSMDKITFDDTESSDWERSNSSSMSWLDESEQETTLKVKNMMDNIEKLLYGEAHAPVPRVVAEECQQWKLRFPHLRVVGKAVDINCMEVLNDNQSYLEELAVAEGNCSPSCDNEDKVNNLEEDQEETYACHGVIEDEPLLSHEFQQPHEPIMDSETRLMHETLLDELTKHVWKEVVEPRVKSFMEKFSKKGKDENAQLSSYKQSLFGSDLSGSPRVLGKHDNDKCILSNDTQMQMPLSAREIATTGLSSNCEPIEFHRRHSDHISLSHRKCKNRLAPCKISEEKDEEMDMKKPEIYWNDLEAEKIVVFNTRMPEITGLQGDPFKGVTQLEERFQFPSPRCVRPTEVTEELKPREKLSISNNLNLRNGRKNEKMKYSEKHYPLSKTRCVRLPAIEDHKWLTKNEASSSYMHGRSSSALPKLAPKTLRPTMSSYKNMQGERTAPDIKHLPFKHEISPLKDEMEDCYNKLYRSHKSSLVQSTIGKTLKAKQEKIKREKYLNT